MTYQELVFFATLNTWPDDGLSDDHIVDCAVSMCEGDPRGDVTHDEMRVEFARALADGMAELRAGGDGTGRMFVFPTPAGRQRFADKKAAFDVKIGSYPLRGQVRPVSGSGSPSIGRLLPTVSRRVRRHAGAR